MRKTPLGTLSIVFVLALIFAAAYAPQATKATHVQPVFVSGNPTCSELAPGTTELRVDPPGAGTFTDGTLSVTITNYTGTSFDFTSNLAVDAVFVKAGPGGNLYDYDPEVTSDTGLVAPDGHEISHILF